MAKEYGRYVLEDRIAMGGMAEIFRARTATAGFDKRVCIKRILPHFLEDAEFVTMFRDEARTAAKLQHANVVQVFDFGEEDGTLYLAMELVDGADLRRVVEQSRKRKIPLEVGEAVQVAIGVCRGLHHAHTLVDNGAPLGIVHRDISPHNILLSRAGEVKVTDFGIARAAERATHTSTGIVKGKVAYMAPEQAQGFDFDHRLDQFALGVVLWEMLCGTRLFTGDNDAQILKKVLDCNVPTPSTLRPEVPSSLDEIVLRALSGNPDDRFADMRQMELALSRFLFSGAVDAAATDVRNVFVRIMDKQPELRRTQIADHSDMKDKLKTADAGLDAASSTESQPASSGAHEPSSMSGISLVFSHSEKNPPAPGAAMTASKGAMKLPTDSGEAAVAPAVADPNALTVMAEGSDELRNPLAPVLNPASSGKNVSAPSESPPPAFTGSLPSVEELERFEESAKLQPAPDATPATRTNVPPKQTSTPPSSPTSSPASPASAGTLAGLSAGVALDEPVARPRRRGPWVAAVGGGVCAVVVAAGIVASQHRDAAPAPAAVAAADTLPAGAPPADAHANTPPADAPGTPADTPKDAPKDAPPADTPPLPAAGADAQAQDAPAHATPPPRHAARAKPHHVEARPAAKKSVALRITCKSKKRCGVVTIAGKSIEVIPSGTQTVLPEGPHGATVEPYAGGGKTWVVPVTVEAGKALVIDFGAPR